MIPYGLPIEIVFVVLFIFGATIGSFLNVCIYRFGAQEQLAALRGGSGFWFDLRCLRDQLRSLVHPPSTCPKCKNLIPGTDNIPIIGWLKLGGKCRFCRSPISFRYPAIELLNGLLFCFVYWMEVPADPFAIESSSLYHPYGPQNFPAWTWNQLEFLNLRYLYHLVLVEALVVATFIDFDIRSIPDGSTVPAMAVGLVAAASIGQVHIVPLWYSSTDDVRRVMLALPDWFDALANGFPEFVRPAVIGCGDLLVSWLKSANTSTDLPRWIGEHQYFHGFLVSLAGFVVGGGVVWIVRIIGGHVLKKEAMGFGDVMLMAMIGSFIGWQPVLLVFFIAPVCAMLIVACSFIFRRESELPYGPYLSVATLIVLFGWQHLRPHAERFFMLGPLLPVLAVMTVVMLYASLVMVQLLKRALGIPLYPEDEVVMEWTSADQLAYFAGENVDDQQGRWRNKNRWEGTSAGRGQQFQDRWLNR